MMPLTMKMFMSAELDLVQASKEAKVCSSVLQGERNDDAVWDALLDKATDIAALYMNPSIPIRAGRQLACNIVTTLRQILLPPIGRGQFTFHFFITLYLGSQQAETKTLAGLSGTIRYCLFSL